MTKPKLIRILIADDHEIVREGLIRRLESADDLQVICQASDGAEAIASYRLHLPDVVLMDLGMPVIDGVTAIEMILAEFSEARIIILSNRDGQEDVFKGWRAGAKGYLVKTQKVEEFGMAIRAVMAGERHISPSVAIKLAKREIAPELSEKEKQVLQYICDGKSNPELLAALAISENTLKTHVKHILSKLSARDRAHAISIAFKRGLVHP